MTWYSQAGQDQFVHGIIGDSGVFVDVGAHDGVVHSNTYALEQRGWTGLCVEPSPSVATELRRNRTCVISPFAMSDHDGTVEIQPTGEVVECTTLANLLGILWAPSVIDYLSIDVEGHECAVLAGMDFDRWQVTLLTVEHNAYLRGAGHKNLIYEYLTRRGFGRVREDVVAPGYGKFEDWFQRL